MSTIRSGTAEASQGFQFGGFLAGIASGGTKLLVGHPFDTVKLRMQTEGRHGRFGGSLWTTVRATAAREGLRGFYRGATPPLFGWMVMDAVMYNEQLLLQRHLNVRLSYPEHALAGIAAGCTVSVVATPVENTKARLQVQYDAASTRYTGPVDVLRQTAASSGILGLWRGFAACLLFRSFFAVLWPSFEFYTRWFTQLAEEPGSMLPQSTVPFLAGGMAANTFWAIAFPADVVKNRIMSQPETIPLRYPSIRSCAQAIYRVDGWRGFYRGFVPCMLRSFPTNGAALFMFDKVYKFVSKPGQSYRAASD